MEFLNITKSPQHTPNPPNNTPSANPTEPKNISIDKFSLDQLNIKLEEEKHKSIVNIHQTNHSYVPPHRFDIVLNFVYIIQIILMHLFLGIFWMV